MRYVSTFNKLAGVESRLPSLPKSPRTPDLLPVKRTAPYEISAEQRRLAGLVQPQLRGATDLLEEDRVATFKRGTAKPAGARRWAESLAVCLKRVGGQS